MLDMLIANKCYSLICKFESIIVNEWKTKIINILERLRLATYSSSDGSSRMEAHEKIQ